MDLLSACQTSFKRFENQPAFAKRPHLLAQRRQAFQHVAQLGLPSSALEDWSYTNTAPIVRGGFAPVEADASSAVDLSKELHAGGSHLLDQISARIVFVNGRFSQALSSAEVFSSSTIPGLTIGLLADRFEGEEASSADEDDAIAEKGFHHLNTAFFEEGIDIQIDANVILAAPIELVFLNAVSTASLISPRVRVTLGKNAEATVVEQHVGTGTSGYLSNSVVELFLDEGAALEHAKLQLERADAFHVSALFSHLARDSRLKSSTFHLGGAIVRQELHPVLAGPGSSCGVHALSLLGATQHVDNFTVMTHRDPHAESTQLFKGVYGDRSRGIFSGTIVVEQAAQKTNAFQRNASLLLSDRASVDTRPRLKIWADDVKCTHGATVGQIDENALFYLRSRGIPGDEAQRILVRAFSAEVVDVLTNESLRHLVEECASRKLQLLQRETKDAASV